MITFDVMLPTGLYNPNEDKLDQASTDKTRSDSLTLRDLNKLKKLRAYRRLDALRRRDRIEVIYGKDDGNSM